MRLITNPGFLRICMHEFADGTSGDSTVPDCRIADVNLRLFLDGLKIAEPEPAHDLKAQENTDHAQRIADAVSNDRFVVQIANLVFRKMLRAAAIAKRARVRLQVPGCWSALPSRVPAVCTLERCKAAPIPHVMAKAAPGASQPYRRHAGPQRLDPQRPLRDGRSCAH